MAISSIVSPVNSLIFIHGSGKWASPRPVKGHPVWSTPTCIASTCYPEVDGPTKIVLGSGQEVAINVPAIFDGLLQTPQRDVVVTAVGDDRAILKWDVLTELTRVRIWHSDPKWPEIVVIGLN
jgi:hypothetical protein